MRRGNDRSDPSAGLAPDSTVGASRTTTTPVAQLTGSESPDATRPGFAPMLRLLQRDRGKAAAANIGQLS
jgi:hypothetical protein